MVESSILLNAIVGLSILLTILCAYLIIKLPKGYGVKYVAVPLLFSLLFFSIGHFTDLLGRPYPKFPEGPFRLMEFRTTGVGTERKIEFWIVQNGESRLYVIPYSEKYFKALAHARQEQRDGRAQLGRFGHQSGAGEGEESLSFSDDNMIGVLPPKDEKGGVAGPPQNGPE